MAYEKQTWECGETITAEKLNHIEDGIESASSGGGTAPLIIRADHLEDCPEGYTGNGVMVMNVTYQQAWDAVNAGQSVYLELDSDGIYSLQNISVYPTEGLQFNAGNSKIALTASEASALLSWSRCTPGGSA